MKNVRKSRARVTPIVVFFNKLSNKITRATGTAAAFFGAIILIVVWLITGPMFHYSNTWQLVINTGTTVVTFLMVFVIQQSQNRDMMAIHLKLNELIACNRDASNKLVDVEHLTDHELEILKEFYVNLSKLCENDVELYSTHSLNEAEKNHKEKIAIKKKERHVTSQQ